MNGTITILICTYSEYNIIVWYTYPWWSNCGSRADFEESRAATGSFESFWTFKERKHTRLEVGCHLGCHLNFFFHFYNIFLWFLLFSSILLSVYLCTYVYTSLKHLVLVERRWYVHKKIYNSQVQPLYHFSFATYTLQNRTFFNQNIPHWNIILYNMYNFFIDFF